MNQLHTKHSKSVYANFVTKLYHILTPNQDLNQNQHHNYFHIIGWNQCGSGFEIYDQEQFAQNILSKYYRHSNISSFIRQLNMYGFRKIKKQNRQFYVHPLFIRDRPQLCLQIVRKPEKKVLNQIQSRNPNQTQHQLNANFSEQTNNIHLTRKMVGCLNQEQIQKDNVCQNNKTKSQKLKILKIKEDHQNRHRNQGKNKKVRFNIQNQYQQSEQIKKCTSLRQMVSQGKIKRKRSFKQKQNIHSKSNIQELQQSSLANLLNNKSQATIFKIHNLSDLNLNLNDQLSICQNLQEKSMSYYAFDDKQKQSRQSVIYWTPSEII